MTDVDFLPHHLIIVGDAISALMDVAECKRPPLLLFSSEEVRMEETVDVTIPVEPEAAAALADARKREGGRSPGQPRAAAARRFAPARPAIAELEAEARAVGLSDADVEAELVGYNAERRDRSSG